MSLSTGTKLGRYEIRSLIGEGGMGEVYLARDPKIGRDVAIKVLPGSLADDKERLARFEQEAQAAGSLNHPNILAIYDVQADGGAPYVVSELLEGETLRDVISGTPLPLRKAVGFGLQVAHGLAAAHEKGIIHRDLKPENLFITADGRVKILDFGLAKLTEANSNGVASTDLPTKKVNTDAGAVMGTVGYMSPEQLRGRQVDQRTDIFSFGSVLYEMLSGQKAFQKDSTADTISAILREEPPNLSDTNKSINPGLERIVHRCLEKNREERFHSASDLAFALEALSNSQSSTGTDVAQVVATTDRRGGNRVQWFGWAAAAILLIVSSVLAYSYFRKPAVQSATVTFVVMPPEKTTFGDSLAISPDGRRIAFIAMAGDGVPALWIRPVDSVDAQKLPGTDGAAFPFWSPDSKTIGFFAANKLKKVDYSGGPPQSLAEASVDPRGGSWSPDGTIIFAPSVTSTIMRISSGGGEPVSITELDAERQEGSHRWPSFLPDGKHFLFFARGAKKELEGVYVGSTDSKERKLIMPSKVQAVYVPNPDDSAHGNLIFARDSALMAQPFDPASLQLTGDATVITQNVRSFPTEVGPTAGTQVSASSDGKMVFRSGGSGLTTLQWMDRNGKDSPAIVPVGIYHEPVLSPDGKRVALSRQDQDNNQDIWILDLTRSVFSRFTLGPGLSGTPNWTPDGTQLIFSSNNGGGHFRLYRRSVSGVGGEEVLFQSEASDVFPDDISPDGKFLIFELQAGSKTKFDLWLQPLAGGGEAYPIIQSEFSDTHARFSPDGKYIAYSSDQTGRSEIYVRSFPSLDGVWQISTSGGDQVQWGRTGKELFYMSLDRKLMSVPYTEGSSFQAGQPVELFATQVPLTGLTDERNHYFASPDAQRFLVNNLVEESSATPLTVIVNWQSMLKK